MRIAVDFDGTVVEHKFPDIGKEIPHAFDTLKRLQRDGHDIILWTVREGEELRKAIEFCHRKGLDFFAVNAQAPGEDKLDGPVCRKVSADIYIDDCNVGGIPDWETIYQMIVFRKTYSSIMEASTAEGTTPHIRYRSGSYSHHHHKMNFFERLASRCRKARAKYHR